MRIITIDPATKKSAYCLVEDKEFISFGKLPTDDYNSWLSMFRGLDMLVIESQYLGFNVRTFSQLIKARGVFEGLAIAVGVRRIEEVAPSTWQAYVLKINKKTLRKERKKRACRIASTLVGQKIKDNDIADAICIAHYSMLFFE